MVVVDARSLRRDFRFFCVLSRFDQAVARALQIEALAGDAEHGCGLLQSSAALPQGVLNRDAASSGDRCSGMSIAPFSASAAMRRISLASCLTLPGQR